MSVNKVILVGHVGKDPEVKNLDNDLKVATCSIAMTEKGYKTKGGIEVPERTEWTNLVFWRGLAKVVEDWVKKGSQIYVEGKLRTRSYDDKEGKKRYVTEVYVDNLNLLDKKSDAKREYKPEDIPPPGPEETDDLPF